MQRPRRTSEFCEDLQATNKRQSRQRQPRLTTTAPSPAPGTAQKYPRQRLTTAPSPAPGTAQKYQRQSRIAVPTRTSSVDRGLNSLDVALQQNSFQRSRSSSYSQAAGRTPLKNTPAHLSKPPGSSSRVLFTAEKHRGGAAGSVALQNDKRWVQEQVERITAYLDAEAFNNKIPGIPTDFFTSRNGGLRQMSVKQFVAIFNYFLQHVGGTRIKPIQNVEDIAKLLPQLHYPYQVNKSWLKSVNTQHSFGNVILLLDFFMNFVTPCNGTEQSQFPSIPIEDDESMRIPDIEFQAKLLRDAEDGFLLWDKGLDDEVSALQQRTCDELIQKRCGASGVNALEAEMVELEQCLKNLEKSRPQIRKQDEDECNQLEEELQHKLQKTETIRDELDADAKKYKQLKKNLQNLHKDIAALNNDVKTLQSLLSKQICNIEERDKLVEEVGQLKHIVQIQELSLRDFQNEEHHQIVLKSRTIKQLQDEIQKFNNDVRAIEFAQINTNADELQLPHHAEPKDLQRIKPIIKKLCETSKAKIVEKMNAIKQLKTEKAAILQDIECNLNPEINSLNSMIATKKKKLQKYKKEIAVERNAILQHATKIEEQLQQTKAQVLELETLVAQKQQQKLKMSEENEQTMKNVEEQYFEIAKAREERLNRTKKELDMANANLLELQAIVDESEKFIENLIKENDC